MRTFLSGQQAKLAGSAAATVLMFLLVAFYTGDWDPRKGGLESALTVIMIAAVDRFCAGGAPTDPPAPPPVPAA